MGENQSKALEEYEIQNKKIQLEYNTLSSKHEQLIAQHRHEERMIKNQATMKKLEVVYHNLKLAGREIFEAECNGYKGLPGINIIRSFNASFVYSTRLNWI